MFKFWFYNRVQLSSPPTSASMINDGHRLYKEGFVLTLTLVDGTRGYGEVSQFFEIELICIFADIQDKLKFVKFKLLVPTNFEECI